MKKNLVCLLVAILTFLLHQQLYADTQSAVTVLAHRGIISSQSHSENTLPAFISAWDKGFGVELDVRVSKDGILVVIHDESVDRISSGANTAYVDGLTAEELSTLGVPTLDRVLHAFEKYRAVFSDKYGIMIEIKTPRKGTWCYVSTVGRQVVSKIALFETDKPSFMVASFNPIVMRTVKSKDPIIARCLNTGEFKNAESTKLSGLTKWLLKNVLLIKPVLKYFVNPTVISFECPLITEKLIQKYHKQNIKVFAWGVIDGSVAKKLVEWGVDGIVTSNPELVQAEINRVLY